MLYINVKIQYDVYGIFFSNNLFLVFKINIPLLLRALYFFICDLPNYFIYHQLNISKRTYIRYKKIFSSICEKIVLNEKRLLGGQEKVIQIDETAWKKGRIIKNPSALLDSDSNILWLVGVIEEETGYCWLEFLPNRKIETISKFLTKNVISGSVYQNRWLPILSQSN